MSTKETAPRKEAYCQYVMDEADLERLRSICYPDNPLDAASSEAKGKAVEFWKELGERMLFKWNTASPDAEDPRRFFAIGRKGTKPNG